MFSGRAVQALKFFKKLFLCMVEYVCVLQVCMYITDPQRSSKGGGV